MLESTDCLGKFAVCMLFLLASASSAMASSNFIIDFSPDSYDVARFAARENNAFYYFFKPYPQDPFMDASVYVRLLDSAGNFLHESAFAQPWFSPYFPGVAKIVVISGSGEVLSERSASLCNNDGICEPCNTVGCTVSENSLTCDDCHTGSKDRFCDLARDSVCDPDCEEKDGDCVYCRRTCFFADDRDFSCSALGGKVCGPRQDCISGEFVYADDAPEGCCLGGKCANLGEYVETTVEMQNQPSMTITPLGELASEVQTHLGDYCTDRLKGSICDPYEYCDGEWVEYYHDLYCCVGECGWKESYGITEEYVAELQNETSRVLSQEDMAYLYNVTYDPEDDYSSPSMDLLSDPEAILASSEKDKFQWDMDEQEQAAQKRQDFIAGLGKVVPKVPEKLKGSGFVVIVTALLSILVVVGFFVWLFNRSAGRKIEAEQRSVQQPSQSQQPAQDLQQSIDSLLAKGFDYAQARDHLLKQGHDQRLVYSEIQKNYQLRRQSSQK